MPHLPYLSIRDWGLLFLGAILGHIITIIKLIEIL